MAEILIHPRRRDLPGLCRRRRAALARALTTELYWRHHLGPELNARFWSAFGDLALAWRRQAGGGGALRRERARFRAALQRESRAALDAAEARRLLADCRRLVARLHPTVTGRPADDAAWAAAEEAFCRGDAAALGALERDTRIRVPAAETRAEAWRLQRALLATERRLARLEAGYPFNLRRELADPGWVASRRAQWGRALAGAAPATAAGEAAAPLAAAAG